mgnify:CR=1 FL=1
MKMSTKTTTENDEKTTVADRLPELTDDELAVAGTNVSWPSLGNASALAKSPNATGIANAPSRRVP